MVCRANEHLDVEGLYRLPDDDQRHELARGHLVSSPPPGARHGEIAANVVYELKTYMRGKRTGVVFTCDTGYILDSNPDTVRAPDVSVLSVERYAAVADQTRLIPGPPDLAVEVLSPRDHERHWRAKVADYLAFGTAMVWVCDPPERTVQVFRGDHSLTLRAEDVLTAPDVLPGFRLPLAELFCHY